MEAGKLYHLPEPTVMHAVTGVSVIFLLSSIIRFIYNAYFHPLAVFPGPKLFGGSNIPAAILGLKGDWHRKWIQLHDKYGPVVRVGVTELSFISSAALNDIYGQRVGHLQMNKTGGASSDDFKGAMHIVNADTKNHVRHRRLLSHAFSDKALVEQERIIAQYIDLFIQRLHESAASDSILDISTWFNYATFDVLGDLAFGQSFDCLRNSTYHPWLQMKISNMKILVWKNILRRTVPLLSPLILKLLPKRVVVQSAEHIRLSKEITQRRLSLDVARPDFLTYILRENYKGAAALTVDEIEANASMLIFAGSETTASILTGATYYLLRHPAVLAKLVQEIRSTFTSEDQMNWPAVSQLRYLVAVFNEAFRLYPPVDGGSNRVVPPGGTIIDGHFVPEGTHVGVPQTPAYRSQRNFKDSHLFIPERWTDDSYATDNRSILQPFSIGPRKCIGRNIAYVEMRLVMCRLLWNFDLELMPGQDDWPNQKLFILWEKGPVLVKLKPIQRC